jgi:hypothetical protein
MKNKGGSPDCNNLILTSEIEDFFDKLLPLPIYESKGHRNSKS